MSALNSTTGFSVNIEKIIKKLVIVILAGLVINLALTLSGDSQHLAASVTDFASGYLALAILFILLPWLINTWRLLIWTRFFGSRMSFIRAYKITLLSELSAAITPSAIGTKPVKVGLLLQEKMPAGAALASVTITIFEDLAFFIVAVPAALLFSSAGELSILHDITGRIRANLLWIIGILPLLILLVFLLIKAGLRLGKRLQQRKDWQHAWLHKLFLQVIQSLQEFKAAYILIRKSGKYRFLITTTLAGIQWLSRYSIITALAASLGLKTEPVLFFALQWIVFSLAVLVPTPGATGGAEAAFYLIFAHFFPHYAIKLLTAGWRFLTFHLFLGIGAALFFIFSLGEKALWTLRLPDLVLERENRIIHLDGDRIEEVLE